jgi:hypothetical protein
MIKLD